MNFIKEDKKTIFGFTFGSDLMCNKILRGIRVGGGRGGFLNFDILFAFKHYKSVLKLIGN